MTDEKAMSVLSTWRDGILYELQSIYNDILTPAYVKDNLKDLYDAIGVAMSALCNSYEEFEK